MRKYLLLFGLALVSSGCVNSRGYLTDRWADTKDIFTASAGIGTGARVRAGPVHAGLYYNIGSAGLRNGEWESSLLPHGWIESSDAEAVALGFEEAGAGASRDKDYEAGGFVPFVTTELKGRHMKEKGSPAYWSQLEVIAGFGLTVRLGFNPGELLDFLLGWTNLDIYGDDLEAWKERGEAWKKAKEKERPKEPPPPPAPAKKD